MLSEKERDSLRRLLGVRVARARQRLKLSQRAMATEFDMSPSWVRQVELGAQFAPAWMLATLSEAIGEPVSWFYGWSP